MELPTIVGDGIQGALVVLCLEILRRITGLARDVSRLLERARIERDATGDTDPPPMVSRELRGGTPVRGLPISPSARHRRPGTRG